MKLISIVTPTYNEEENVQAVYEQVKAVFSSLAQYEYEHIFIDNRSTDTTVRSLKSICKKDKNIKLIVNARNFGPVRSPCYGNLQATGDAVIHLVADLQDPPELIKDFLKKWEEGYKVVVGVKPESMESPLMFAVRKAYYNLVSKIADIKLIKNYTGFGLYDRKVIEVLREIDDPYPYFRGLIAEIGFEAAQIEYVQPARKKGITSTNFYSLYDQAMLGITNHSKVPLRLMTMLGFVMSIISILIAFGFLIAKLINWDSFQLGIAPILIGIFFFGAIQMFFIGLLGEYVGSIYTRVRKLPMVVEDERINF